MGGVAVLLFAAAFSVFAERAQAEALAYEVAAPAPSWARSIEVVDDGAPVMLAPDDASRRRGTVAAGTRLGFARRVFGEGCSTGVWYQTRDALFICERHVEPSPVPPGPAIHEAQPGARLPQRYAFVRFDGARAYAHPSDYFRNDYVEAFGRGFGIVVTGEQTYEGVGFIRTRRHLWVERSSVQFAEGSRFAGHKLAPGERLDLAWAARKAVAVHRTPGGPVVERLSRHSLVRVARDRGAWAQLQRGGWVRNARLSRPRLVDPPEHVGPDERWIDVDVTQQVLVAYQGTRPMFATLVSTGRDTPRSKTPLGVFRIWVKLDYSDMDDLERSDVSENYAIQDVPWVQFFKGSYALHAAFWHDDFGRARSHGCINLSPADARFLFGFTHPVLPPGWNAILPMPEDRPTTIRVRGHSRAP